MRHRGRARTLVEQIHTITSYADGHLVVHDRRSVGGHDDPHRAARPNIDPDVKDAEIRSLIYQQIAPEDLRSAVDECAQIMRPLDDSYFDLLATRYSMLRQFAPRFLDLFTWRAAQEDDALLRAIAVLKELNDAGARKIPADAPREFISATWDSFSACSGSRILMPPKSSPNGSR